MMSTLLQCSETGWSSGSMQITTASATGLF
jgi:hypothetical protein